MGLHMSDDADDNATHNRNTYHGHGRHLVHVLQRVVQIRELRVATLHHPVAALTAHAQRKGGERLARRLVWWPPLDPAQHTHRQVAAAVQQPVLADQVVSGR